MGTDEPGGGRHVSPRFRLVISLAVAVSLLAAGCGGGDGESVREPGSADARLDLVRIGWQVPWATQGQVAQALAHTDILERNGIEGRLVPFTFGAPLNEAALAGDVDVLFTADQPAATLVSNSSDFTIVARLMYNRVSIYVPPNSEIEGVGDLRGRTLAVPFGAAAQREALRAIIDAGLDPRRDVKVINLDLVEQAALVAREEGGRWGDIDALAGFDPTPAIFEANGSVRLIHTGTVVAVVVMRKEMLEHRDLAERFLRSYATAWLYFARNRSQVNSWYKKEAKFTFQGEEPLEISARVEPNVKATSFRDLRITFTDNDLTVMQEAADFLLENKLIKSAVRIRDYVDTTLAQSALESLSDDDLDAIRAK
jgi:ABC-type nitrate/sulfonate/bicarbonate transport system substrate-binding protein